MIDGREKEHVAACDEDFADVIDFGFDDHAFEAIGKGSRVERHLHGPVNVSV